MLIIRASLRFIEPQITGILYIVEQEFARAGCETVVMTSGWRVHAVGQVANSLHPKGFAADFDSQQMSEDWNDHTWQALKVALKDRLGDEYDVVIHGPRAHAHIEYDINRVNRKFNEAIPV